MYEGNALYSYLDGRNDPSYLYFYKSQWLLLYANRDCMPQLCVFAFEHTKGDELPYSAMNDSLRVANALRMPFLTVAFTTKPSTFWITDLDKTKWSQVSSYGLCDVFHARGLEVATGVSGLNGARKVINQYESSTYHRWQRTHLGRVIVTDLDLIGFPNRSFSSIIELKRSKVPLHKWRPYRQDYVNFAVIANAYNRASCDARFFITYNLLSQATDPRKRNDDISKIKVFEMRQPKGFTNGHDLQWEARGIFRPESLFESGVLLETRGELPSQ